MKRLLVLLVLALPLASCARSPDYATDVRDAPAPPAVYFNGEPTYVLVPGTNTYWYDNTSGDLDLYRFGDAYWLTTGNWWYRAQDYDGPYRAVYRANVPGDVFTAVDYRQRHGDNDLRARRWGNDDDRRADRRAERRVARGPSAINVNLQTRPRFMRVSNSDVYYATETRGNYELFRYQDDFYAYRNGSWYRNDDVRGTYQRVPRRSVPAPVVSAASRVMGRDWRRNVGD